MYIPKGVQEASDILSKSTNYFVYYDPDIDGLVSGSFVTNLLRAYGKPSTYYINENRAHGFKIPLEKLEAYKGYTIIAVDFVMTDQELMALVDMGINVINIDHHETEHTELFTYTNPSNNCSCVLINNQYCFEPEEHRYLSGAGMVYHVFCALFPEFDTQQNRALVGISLLSDIRAIENDFAAAFLTDLYRWNDSYSIYLIDLTKNTTNFSFGVQKYLDRNYVDFSFSPKFNALFRMNMGDIAIKLFNRVPVPGFDISDIRLQQKIIESNLRANLKDVSVTKDLKVMCVDVADYTNQRYNITNFIGLACGGIKEAAGATSFVFVKDGNRIVRGSVRGKFDGLNYIKIFESFGFVAAGHKGAFGATIDDLSQVDFVALSNAIAQAELEEHAKDGNRNLFVKVSNLYSATLNETKIPMHNNYVRDERRLVYDCSDCTYKIRNESKTKDYVEYSIDGVAVKCFDKSLTPQNGGYVMPILTNGYVEYFLKKRVR